MIKRFQGAEGRNRLITAVRKNGLVSDEEAIAIELVDAGELREYSAGDVLIDQGGSDTDLFMIVAGEVDIVVNGRKITSRRSGSCVGEMVLIDPTASRAATVVASSETVALVVSEPAFTGLATNHAHLWRRLALELGDRLRQRNVLVRPSNTRPQLFVGCSVEHLEAANHLQLGLDHTDADVIVWSNGVFGPSSNAIDDLLSQAEKTDFAVLILGEEDAVESRGAHTPAPRDNVIFELGLFMGQLGKSRTLIVKQRGSKTKIPTDLLGLTPIEYSGGSSPLSARLGPTCTAIMQVVQRLGPR